jgi:hypothetical protein
MPHGKAVLLELSEIECSELERRGPMASALRRVTP